MKCPWADCQHENPPQAWQRERCEKCARKMVGAGVGSKPRRAAGARTQGKAQRALFQVGMAQLHRPACKRGAGGR